MPRQRRRRWRLGAGVDGAPEASCYPRDSTHYNFKGGHVSENCFISQEILNLVDVPLHLLGPKFHLTLHAWTQF